MKRIWFSVIFILIALGVCTYEQITVNSYYKDITQTIEKLADKRDDSVDDALIETKSELDQIFDTSKITFSNIF